jgi:hypothetical protein
VLWKDKFKQAYPKETQYRHSLAEEVDRLTTAASVAEETTGKTGNQAIAKDPNIQLLRKLYRAKMLEPYVLLSAPDQGISQDYAAYRAQNRAKLLEYLGELWRRNRQAENLRRLRINFDGKQECARRWMPLRARDIREEQTTRWFCS